LGKRGILVHKTKKVTSGMKKVDTINRALLFLVVAQEVSMEEV